MTPEKFFKTRLYVTALVSVAIWLLLIWDYKHGGVPSHHLLNSKDLPAFSNWWGGIFIPFLTWFLLFRVHKRVNKTAELSTFPSSILYAFIAALCFALLLSLTFTMGLADIPFYLLVALLVVALFIPIYRAECFLGFVLGMTYTFGGVLPILIVSILTLLGSVLYLVIRPAILSIASRLSFKTPGKNIG
jgi:hypothetical protein